MGNYGRHVTPLQTPPKEYRLGRYITGDEPILQWAPVRVPDDAELDAEGRLPLELCTGATAPKVGKHGLICYEQPDANFAGYDPMLARASDLDMAPANTAVQLVHGRMVRVEYRNYAASSFGPAVGGQAYAGRIMVAGAAIATPTVDVFDLLTPGTGTDEDGYWAETGSEDNAWLRVTAVDHDRGLVQCQLLF
jgi:hypothetical protein